MNRIILIIICLQTYQLYSQEKEKVKKEIEDRTDLSLSYSSSRDSSGVNYIGLDVLRIINLKSYHNLLVDLGFDYGISDAKDNYLFYIAPGYRLYINKSDTHSHYMFVDMITGTSMVSVPSAEKLALGVFSSFGVGFQYKQISISAKSVYINSSVYSDQFLKVGFSYSF